jgi:hypothetical protein
MHFYKSPDIQRPFLMHPHTSESREGGGRRNHLKNHLRHFLVIILEQHEEEQILITSQTDIQRYWVTWSFLIALDFHYSSTFLNIGVEGCKISSILCTNPNKTEQFGKFRSHYFFSAYCFLLGIFLQFD